MGTEADEQTVERRLQRLANTLEAAGMPARTSQERIAIWVPRWHIETWLLFLNGHEVDESTNLKDLAGEVEIKAAAREFVQRFRQWARDPGTVSVLPSILSAFEETRRIQQALDRATP